MAKKLDKVDVVICGAGWAGGIVAAELTKEGYNVVALERGKDQSQADFIGAKDELRYSRRFDLMQDLAMETITSRNYEDETAKPVSDNENFVIGTGTGGSGIHWSGHSYRWLPYDFEIYSKTVEKHGENRIPKGMQIQDWGITYDELEPYYDKFERTAGISGEPSPIGPKRSNDYPNPPLKKNTQIRLFEKATKELGYHPYMLPSGNISQKYTNPDGETINACVYCSFCEHYGCDFGAKADPIVTVLSTAKKSGNFELRNESYVTRVIHDGKKATALKYIDLNSGEEYEQPADLVVLAGFVFTNNKLLLLSNIGAPYDAKNETGIIGRNMTCHDQNLCFTGAIGYFNDKKFNSFAGAGSLGMTIDDFNPENIDSDSVDFLHGFSIFTSIIGSGAIGSSNLVPSGTPFWGKEFKDKSIYYTNRNLIIVHQKGTLPWKHNFYDLDPTYKDAFGDPLLRVTRKYTDQDKKLALYAIEKCTEIMEQMGADIVDPMGIPEEFPHSYQTGHFAGGVIMGDNPETSAVNNYSQMWEMDNLFVVGPSAFPHYSSYNPTVTIGALAYRATEGMIEYLKGNGGLLIKRENKGKTKA